MASDSVSLSPDQNYGIELKGGSDIPEILIVEDEGIVSLDLEYAVEDAGMNVLAAVAAVEDAMQILENQRPHAAILDMRLRDGEALPVADRLLELGIPFVFHSAHAEPTHYKDGYPNVKWFRKPSDATKIVDYLMDNVVGKPNCASV